MREVRILEIKQSVFADNDRQAEGEGGISFESDVVPGIRQDHHADAHD